MSVKITGVDVLVKELKKQASLQDVKNAVKMNTANLQKQAMRKAPVDTGNLKRSITIDILDGGHTGKVTATADYSIYQEYGTRFMSAQPFMRPSLSIIEPQFRKRLRAINEIEVITISPHQRIWTDIRMICVGVYGEAMVFDYLPEASTPYPFIFIGEQFKQNERLHKDYLNGVTQVTVHYWHNNPRKRGSLATMMDMIEISVYQVYKGNIRSVDTDILIDNSTGSDLIHGVQTFSITF